MHGVGAARGDVLGSQKFDPLAPASPAEVEPAGEPRLRDADSREGIVGAALELDGEFGEDEEP